MRPSQRAEAGVREVIGADRSVRVLTERLLSGESVLLAGAFGSGKSHLAAAVAAELARLGHDPVVVHGSAALRSAPYGALDVAEDDRLEALRPGEQVRQDAPTMIVVDDAHLLDEFSLQLLTRSILRGRSAAVFAVGADPDAGDVPGTPTPLNELWLEGRLHRVDLAPLDPDTSEQLLADFVGAGLLDSVTRRVLHVRAHGSRRLLRELAFDAAAESVAGRDPIAPGRELPAGSRVGDVLAAAVADLDDEQHRALAVVGRLRGIASATACRFIDPVVIDSLVLRGAVHVDDRPDRGLYADPYLAAASTARLATGRLEVALDVIVTRALATPEHPRGAALDRLIAASWHSARPSTPPPESVDPETRRRILAGAAHSANSAGRSDLALAYTAMARRYGDHASLRLEASRARAGLQDFAAAFAELTGIDAAGVAAADLRRIVRWWGSLTTWLPVEGVGASLTAWLEASGIDDPSILCEIEVHRAEAACLAMDWSTAVAVADAVLEVDEVHTLARVRAAIMSAFADTQRGRFEEGLAKLAAADRANRDPVTGRPVSLMVELALLCFEGGAALAAGRAMPAHAQRLRAVTLLAAQRDDRSSLSLAGVAAAVVLGIAAHDPDVTDLELEAALRRLERIELAVWRPLLAYLRVTALARNGRADDARAALDEIDDQLLSHHLIYRYSRETTAAEISHRPVGRRPVETKTSPDTYFPRRRGFARGGGPGERARAGVHPTSSVPPRATVTRPDPAATSAPVGAPAAAPAPAGQGSADEAGQRDGARAMGAVLTERELEVALLVARQLSNKEIAHQLYLSVRTVESHVYTARGKLGARTRRELGRIVAGADESQRSGDAPGGG
ncbi:LuxR C-terminal-related transcriptional regulator [Herbiconiux sp. A18JL235]|uniref:LuxR C-terminal-related transcriptional regulator n=1 Tax=Herbiconiux sp. A18JL235 TaxID=3152363 RepID=A0AB39BIL2_9MICO